MNLPIIWAPTAEEDYAAILNYIETIFGTEAAFWDNRQDPERLESLPW